MFEAPEAVPEVKLNWPARKRVPEGCWTALLINAPDESREVDPPRASNKSKPAISRGVCVVLGKIPAEVFCDEVTDNGHSRKPNPVFDPAPPDPFGEVPSMSGDFRRSWTRSATILYWPLLPEPSGLSARDIVMVATKEGEEGI